MNKNLRWTKATDFRSEKHLPDEAKIEVHTKLGVLQTFDQQCM